MDGYRTQTNDVKNRLYILVSAGMVLPAAFLFYVVSGLPHVFIIACLGFILSFFIRKPLKYSDRSIIYSVVIALILVVLLDLVFPMKQDRFFHIGRIFRPNITIPLVIYLAVFATFYESSNYTLGFNAAFSLLVILIGGDYQERADDLSGGVFNYLLSKENYTIFFLTVSIVNIVMILTAFNLARKSLFHKVHYKLDWKKIYATVISLLLTGFLAVGLLFIVKTFRRELLQLESYVKDLRYKNKSNPSGIMFDREIDLTTTIKADRKKHSRMIMLRVRGTDIPPGYMRGRVYQFYSNGKWRQTAEKPEDMNFKINVDGLAINAFFKAKDPGIDGEAISIYPSSSCYAKYLFIPGNTKRIDMVADRLNYKKNGYFEPELWEKDGGYTARVNKIDQFAAFPDPDNFEMLPYLNVPSNLSSISQIIMQKISRDNSDMKLTDREITQKVVTFFNTNFKYTLQPEPPPSEKEPLEHFITSSKSGHCELFASSTAILLRASGIPTRYVTGLLCQESHPSGDYFVSRLGDAHAWVEAYLRDEKKWILVEPTPPASSNTEHEWGFFEVWIDRIQHSFQKIFADIRRGYVARAVLNAVIDFFTFLWDIISNPFGVFIFFLIICLAVWRFKFYNKRKYQLALKLDNQTLLIQKKIRKIEKYIEQQTGIKRESQTTFNEWLEKIGKSQKIKHENLKTCEELVKLYQNLRFSTVPVEEKDIAKLEKMVILIK